MKTTPRILIVEDEPAIAELLTINLKHNGFAPVWAGEGVAAQRELDAVLPDVILLDWMLPGQSGLSLARRNLGRQHATQARPQRNQIKFFQFIAVVLRQIFEASKFLHGVFSNHFAKQLSTFQP